MLGVRCWGLGGTWNSELGTQHWRSSGPYQPFAVLIASDPTKAEFGADIGDLRFIQAKITPQRLIREPLFENQPTSNTDQYLIKLHCQCSDRQGEYLILHVC